jgi:hypothetical protein
MPYAWWAQSQQRPRKKARGTVSPGLVATLSERETGLTHTGITQFYFLGCELADLNGSVTLTFPPVSGATNIVTTAAFSGHFRGPRISYVTYDDGELRR